MSHSRRASSRRSHLARSAGSVVVLLCVVAGGLSAGCASTAVASQNRQLMTVPLPTATPSPTPQPTPSLQERRNAAAGCDPAAPAPFPRVIADASPQTAGDGQSSASTEEPQEVALTFDDGPAPTTTPHFLDYLEQTHTQATFFVIGDEVQTHPELLQREWRDGFAIGVHTWDHPMMTQQTLDGLHHQFGDTLKLLHSVLGSDACIWLWRPPYGDVNGHVLQVAAHYGLTTITWGDSGLDWTQPGTQNIADMILRLIHPGSIVLMHDGPTQRQQTLDALPLILAGLKARGLTPVTVPRLLADEGYPGVRVSSPPLAPKPVGAHADG